MRSCTCPGRVQTDASRPDGLQCEFKTLTSSSGFWREHADGAQQHSLMSHNASRVHGAPRDPPRWTTLRSFCGGVGVGGQLWCGGNSRTLDARSTSRWSDVHLRKVKATARQSLLCRGIVPPLCCLLFSSPRGHRLCFASLNAGAPLRPPCKFHWHS